MNTLNAQTQIDAIRAFDLPELLEKMPVNGFDKNVFTAIGESWALHFTYTSPLVHFAATGTGPTPREAFEATKTLLMRQIEEWHLRRETDENYFPDEPHRRPVVMIVDDDVDTARSIEMTFKQLGCVTILVTEPHLASRAISFEEADFIILDWKLARHIEGADVLRRASRLIDSLSDLRTRFGNRQPKVITHSILDRGQIEIPSSQYFHHMDHWQKPMRFEQLAIRGGAVLDACGF